MTTDNQTADLAFVLDPLDRYRWRWALDHVDGLASEVSRWTDHDPGWPGLGAEFVGRLYSGDELEPVEEPADWADRAHRTAEALPEWRQLLEVCAGDRWSSAASGAAVARAALEVRISDLEREQEQAAADGQKRKGPQAQQDGQGGAMRGGQGDGPRSSSPAEQARADAVLRQAIREASRKAIASRLEEREADEALTFGWGSEGTGHKAAPAGERERLAAELRKRPGLRRIAARVGRLLRTAATKRRTAVTWSSQVLADVTTGRDVARMLPAELALLGDEDLEIEFCRRFIEGRALCYRLDGREAAARGPMVVAVDCSSSMDGARNEWAIALTLALVHTAAREGRAATVIPFDTAAHEPIEVTRSNLVAATLQIATLGAYGGTSWAAALLASQVATDYHKRADAVLITDGECDLPAEFVDAFGKWLRSSGASLFSLLVGDDCGDGRALEQLGEVYRIRSLEDGAEVDVVLATSRR